jgi:hypothetical protein
MKTALPFALSPHREIDWATFTVKDDKALRVAVEQTETFVPRVRRTSPVPSGPTTYTSSTPVPKAERAGRADTRWEGTLRAARRVTPDPRRR